MVKKEINYGKIWIIIILVSIYQFLLLTNTEYPPRPSESTMVWKEWNTSFRYMRVRSTDMERRKVFQPNTNTSLNRRYWNTFMISRTRSERTDGFKEIPQRFPKPRFWGVKTQMLNWDLSLIEFRFNLVLY